MSYCTKKVILMFLFYLDSCDCDEFAGAPLAKKINSLQINKANLQNNTESQVKDFFFTLLHFITKQRN